MNFAIAFQYVLYTIREWVAKVRKWFRKTPQIHIHVNQAVSTNDLIREIQKREQRRGR